MVVFLKTGALKMCTFDLSGCCVKPQFQTSLAGAKVGVQVFRVWGSGFGVQGWGFGVWEFLVSGFVMEMFFDEFDEMVWTKMVLMNVVFDENVFDECGVMNVVFDESVFDESGF